MSLTTSSPVQFEVEWRVPVGCGFSGFFTEVALGFVPGLHDKGVAVRLLTGKCDDVMLNLRPVTPLRTVPRGPMRMRALLSRRTGRS